MTRSRHPTVGVYYSTFKRVMIESVIIWTCGILFGSPCAYFQELQTTTINFTLHYDLESELHHRNVTVFNHCIQTGNPAARATYTTSLFVFEAIVPAVVLLVTSALIAKQSAAANAGANGDVQGWIQDANANVNVGMRDTNIIRTLMMMSLSFTVCWIPLHVVNVLLDMEVLNANIMSPERIYLTFAIAHAVAMVSIPLNAVMYGWLTPSIKREILFWRRRRSNPVLLHLFE